MKIQMIPSLRTFITKESAKKLEYPSFPVCIHVSTGERPWCHRNRFSGVIEVSRKDISVFGSRWHFCKSCMATMRELIDIGAINPAGDDR
jgi:hypothetical protein